MNENKLLLDYWKTKTWENIVSRELIDWSGGITMYLYSITNEKESDGFYDFEIGDTILLQHKKDFSEEQFSKMIEEYRYESTRYMLRQLEKEHGFRLVPTVNFFR